MEFIRIICIYCKIMVMKKIFVLIIMLLLSTICYAQLPKQLEKYYTNKFATIVKGKTQQYLSNKRYADIITDTFAIEVEYANKFPESIGQSLDYSMVTYKKAGILLIVNDKNDDKYVDELMEIIYYHKLQITVWLMDYNTDKWCKVDQFTEYSYSYQFK
jgi:hypothetical protein